MTTFTNKPHILLFLPFNLFRVSRCPQRHLQMKDMIVIIIDININYLLSVH